MLFEAIKDHRFKLPAMELEDAKTNSAKRETHGAV